MIRGEDFVYYGPEVWQSMWRNRHQLLSRLARANRVVYVEPRPYIEQITAALRASCTLRTCGATRGLAPALPGLWTYRSPRYALGRAAARPRCVPLAAAGRGAPRPGCRRDARAHRLDFDADAVRCAP